MKKPQNKNIDEILYYHNKYVLSLQQLYDKYKHLYPQAKKDLRVVDKVSTKDVKQWNKRFAKL